MKPNVPPLKVKMSETLHKGQNLKKQERKSERKTRYFNRNRKCSRKQNTTPRMHLVTLCKNTFEHQFPANEIQGSWILK